MASNSALVVSSLDFDTIRTNLSNYLKSQTQFQDYDFDGSNLSVLLDILSYNTYMNNFYTNMAISETFLDSAQLLDSVVSRAKELNYTPRSAKSAAGVITIQINPGNTSPASIVVPAGTMFNARIDNNIFTFTTASATILSSANSYTQANVSIYEGSYVTESFLVNTSTIGQRFILNNPNIDTSSLIVSIQNSTTDTTNTTWTQATTLLGATSTSTIYFVQAATNGKYELVFGDNTVSSALINGNVINATYRITSGSIGNLATSFQPASPIAGYPTSAITVTSTSPASGGGDQETIDSIRLNAPRHYQTLDRAITKSDYQTILFEEYPDIRAINVYGGEEVYPPQYGKVFISIDLNEFQGIPVELQNSIQNFLKTKNPIEIMPVVVVPDYLYINVTAGVLYSIGKTTLAPSDIQNQVINAINQYNNTYLNNFDITFRYSKLSAYIDEANDASILSVNLNAQMELRFYPTINQAQAFSLNYNNPVVSGSVISNGFTYNNTVCFLNDDGNGNIDLSTLISGNQTIVLNNVGTIDYTTGAVIINLPAITAYNNQIALYADSVSHDFTVKNNTILLIDPADVNVSVTATA